uniref:Uncharacterized protein n=1 Tax=Chenopodium quinoa TaxID=63459 RepID=A0A803N720_CHEQI
MDPVEVQQIEKDVQQLEQVRQHSKRPLSTIVPLESRGESIFAQGSAAIVDAGPSTFDAGPADTKYILHVEAKDWVMETLDQSWRGFKCRLKRDHYYMYDTYEERLKHPPERVPEAHYKTLLAYSGTTIAKQAMRELEASQDDQSGESIKDPFDEVMGNARREEVMESIKSVVTADVQKDINAEIEEFAKEKEVHAAQVAAQEAEIERKTKELESETLKLQEIRMDIENQQGNITLDAVISALAQLRQKDPSLTPEFIAKALFQRLQMIHKLYYLRL